MNGADSPNNRRRDVPGVALRALCLLVTLAINGTAMAESPSRQAAEGNSRVDAPAETGRLFVYISLGGEQQIAIYEMDAKTGTLTAAGKVALSGVPGCLAVGPKREFLYAAIRSTDSVTTLRIDSRTGGLTPVKTVPVAGNPVYLAVDHTGRNLLTASYSGDKAAVYPIGRDRTVAARATQILDMDDAPHSILMDPSNRFVFIPNTLASTIFQFHFDSWTGTLTPAAVPKLINEKGTGPRHVFFHPSLDVVYFVNETNSSVTAYKLAGRSGMLSTLETLSTLPAGFSGENSCADIELTPSGRFLYASNRGHDSIAAFAVDPDTGRLTSLGQEATEKTPRSFNIDPTSRFLYAAGQSSGRLASYRIDSASGRLRPLAVYDVGSGPSWVLVAKLPGK